MFRDVEPKSAVVLVSGGLDSATVLAIAKDQGYRCFALSLDYGQRHRVELEAASVVAEHIGVAEHRIITLGLSQLGGSALTDSDIPVPVSPAEGIPVTYVPARNTIFLAIALGWAEILGAHDLFIGVNAVDYSGYPDCRPEFIQKFEALANLATRAGVEGESFRIQTPLIEMSKAQIIKEGRRLGVDYALTVSCYQPAVDGKPCGACDSCRLRANGFAAANMTDPAETLWEK
ncbi:7-cyano-7-deazaguanine synthase QueC [Pseudomonadota bacterium]